MLHFIEKGGIIVMKRSLLSLLREKGVAKMDIMRISVGGFRNISTTQLLFENSITAFVGLNGYGKSNLFDAIDLGFTFIKCPNQFRDYLMGQKSNIPILKANAGNNYSFEIEAKLTSNNTEYFILYGFEFSWKTSNTLSGITKEYLKIKENLKSQKYKTFISRIANKAKYLSSETGRCDKAVKIDETSLVLNKLTAFDDLFYIDVLIQLENVAYYVERHLDAAPSYDPDPFVVKGFEELNINDIRNIPRAIYYLKKDYADKYALLMDGFKQLFPDIKDIIVKKHKVNTQSEVDLPEEVPFVFSDNVYSMSIIDDKIIQPISFARLSDGTKRLFLMLTFAIIADIKGLSMIAIEEPENSIHPGLFQSYLDVLSQITNSCKIIITSHSPYIIQYINPHSIYIGLPSNTGETDFRRIALAKVNSLYKDAIEYDKSIGDYIFNILSESDSKDYIMRYLETNG